MKLLQAYDFYFYRLYCWSCLVNKRMHGGTAYNSLVAVIMMTLALWLNISFLIMLCLYISNRKLPNLSNTVIVGSVIFIWIVNYLYFVAARRYKLIISHYHHESRNSIRYGLVGTFVYFLLSVVLFFVAVLTSVPGWYA